jgi:hypothetical protein
MNATTQRIRRPSLDNGLWKTITSQSVSGQSSEEEEIKVPLRDKTSEGQNSL